MFLGCRQVNAGPDGCEAHRPHAQFQVLCLHLYQRFQPEFLLFENFRYEKLWSTAPWPLPLHGIEKRTFYSNGRAAKYRRMYYRMHSVIVSQRPLTQALTKRSEWRSICDRLALSARSIY